MKRFLLPFLFAVLSCSRLAAQDTTAPAAFDSAAVLTELNDLLKGDDAAISYGMVSLGMGNRLFSKNNNLLNAKQSASGKLVFSPGFGYFHKSGFSISAGSSLLQDSAKGFMATQFSLTPAFDLVQNDNWMLGISYSHYFVRDKYSVYASPVQNDWYLYAGYKKSWLEPGIAVGFSTGNFREILKLKTLSGNTLTDTGTYYLKTFSAMLSAGHDFDWSAVFGKNDALSLNTTLQLNFGSDSTKSVSHTIAPALVRFLSKRKRLQRLQGSNKFAAQSLGMSIDANYSIGKFTLMPQLYLDYYLPATEDKRLSQTFTITAGYTF